MHNEEGGIVTSLPVLFENRVVDVLLTLKEIVNETYEDTLPEVNQELREMAKAHFSVLLEVSHMWPSPPSLPLLGVREVVNLIGVAEGWPLYKGRVGQFLCLEVPFACVCVCLFSSALSG